MKLLLCALKISLKNWDAPRMKSNENLKFVYLKNQASQILNLILYNSLFNPIKKHQIRDQMRFIMNLNNKKK